MVSIHPGIGDAACTCRFAVNKKRGKRTCVRPSYISRSNRIVVCVHPNTLHCRNEGRLAITPCFVSRKSVCEVSHHPGVVPFHPAAAQSPYTRINYPAKTSVRRISSGVGGGGIRNLAAHLTWTASTVVQHQQTAYGITHASSNRSREGLLRTGSNRRWTVGVVGHKPHVQGMRALAAMLNPVGERRVPSAECRNFTTKLRPLPTLAPHGFLFALPHHQLTAKTITPRGVI